MQADTLRVLLLKLKCGTNYAELLLANRACSCPSIQWRGGGAVGVGSPLLVPEGCPSSLFLHWLLIIFQRFLSFVDACCGGERVQRLLVSRSQIFGLCFR